jgi:tetratricopeptide (TPR) repeat protein
MSDSTQPTPAERARYWAFISYSHRDSAWADWLHKAIERYRLPKALIGTDTPRGTVPKRLTPVFRDRDELPSATDLGALLTAALAESNAQIVICSPQAAKSKWVNEEILAFKRLGREDRIFCLIVGGEPNASDMPGREEEECFPPALRFRLGADGALSDMRTEPIAADARPGKDGKSNAKLKLISGVLGVGFDSLRRREQQRRNQRLFWFSCSAAAGMVLTTSLAAYALIQRGAAQRQTLRAEAEARTAKETTRFLVDLFKISDPSEARGNSVTAREMLDKGAKRVDTELAKVPAIQATLMDTLGTVYMGLGLYDQARPLVDRAVATRRGLESKVPGDLSDSLSHQGELLFLQADYPAGEKAYRDAIRIEMANPGDPDAQAQLADSMYGLGKLLSAHGQYPEAEKNLREALRLQRSIHGESDARVARTLKELGQEQFDAGDVNAAIPLLRSAVAMQRELRAGEPYPDLAEVLNDMGQALWQHGDFDEAEKYYRESLAMKRRLLGEKHPEVAAGMQNLASSLQDKGDLAGAETLYRQAYDMQHDMLGADHPDVARALLNLASLQYDRGDKQTAIANMREVVKIYRKAYAGDHPDTAKILNALGFRLISTHDYAEAERDLAEGLAMRRRLFDDHQPDVASSLTNMAMLKNAQGKYSDALTLAQQARQIYTQALTADHWRTAIAESAEGSALRGLARYPEAEICLTHSNDILSKNSGAPAIFRTLTAQSLEGLHRDAHRLARASSAHAAVAVQSASR